MLSGFGIVAGETPVLNLLPGSHQPFWRWRGAAAATLLRGQAIVSKMQNFLMGQLASNMAGLEKQYFCQTEEFVQESAELRAPLELSKPSSPRGS